MPEKKLKDLSNKEVKHICDLYKFNPCCNGCPLKRYRHDVKLNRDFELFCFVELKLICNHQLTEEEKEMLVKWEE